MTFSAIAVYLAILTAMIAVVSVVLSPVLKYFAPTVPWLSCALLLFWALLRMALLIIAYRLAVSIFDLPFGLAAENAWNLFSILAFAWMLSRDLHLKYGYPTKFPGPGAKVIFTLIVVGWAIVLVVWGVMYFR